MLRLPLKVERADKEVKIRNQVDEEGDAVHIKVDEGEDMIENNTISGDESSVQVDEGADSFENNATDDEIFKKVDKDGGHDVQVYEEPGW